jgi:hypothetical protein
VAEIFDQAAVRDRLGSAEEVRVEGGWSPEACYLAAWLLDGVARAGGQARARLERAEGVGVPVSGLALSGPGLDVAIGAPANGCAEIRVQGVVRRAALPPPPPWVPLGEELGLVGDDPVYKRVLPAAGRLATSALSLPG